MGNALGINLGVTGSNPVLSTKNFFMKREDILMVILVVIVCGLFYHISNNLPKYERIVTTECSVITNKQSSLSSINRRVYESYFFLLENGKLEEVDMKSFMTYEKGDKFCYYNVTYNELQ